MIKHLIFDFDGVIADTADVNWALSQEHDPTATYEDFLAHHDGNVFADAKIKFKPENLRLFYSEYHKRLTPERVELALAPLRRLAPGYTMHIISSNSEEVIKEVLRKSDVLHLFARVMGAETHKSKIEKFKMLIQDGGITPDNALFITDTLGDIKEAHKVGIRSIAETFGFHNRDRLALGEPFKIVDSWEEIEAVLDTMGDI